MNLKRALKVIDDKMEYIRKNTFSARGEDKVRVKLSDLRAVIMALSEPESSINQECEHEWIWRNISGMYSCSKCNYWSYTIKPNTCKKDPIKEVHSKYKYSNVCLWQQESANELWQAICAHVEGGK